MRKAFTLLELIIVVIIIAILATLAFVQYQNMVERSRGAEARSVLGSIRKQAQGYYIQYGTIAGFNYVLAGIGRAGDQIPGPTAADCRDSNYFYFNPPVTSPDGTGARFTGTRCTSGGKEPQGTGLTIFLDSNFSSGEDSWGGTGNY